MAFTLVELLVVISIIALLLAILLPALGKAKDAARTVVCLSNQRQTGLAMRLYANDFNDFALSPQPWFRTPPARNERYWPDTLMRFNYLPDLTLSQNGSYTGSGLVYGTAVKEKNPFSCPALPPPPMHKISGKTFPMSGTRASSILCYGMREIYRDTTWNVEKSYPGEQYDNTYRLPKLSTLSNRGPFMADTASVWTGEEQRQDVWFFLNLAIWSGTEYVGSIDRRHLDAANFWFPDGSAKSMGLSDIQSLPNTQDSPNLTLYSIP
ncbi:MAG: type II secretion system protein [Phycisphaerales bacterium]